MYKEENGETDDNIEKAKAREEYNKYTNFDHSTFSGR